MKHVNWMADHALKVKQALISEVRSAYKAGDLTIEEKVLEIQAINSKNYQEALAYCKQAGVVIPKVNACY